jgi:iron complex transport system substrate-binding protein
VLGKVTGHAAQAAETTTKMKTDIAGIVAAIPDRAAPLTYYHELDDTLFTVTSKTFIGQIYSLAGLENIADEADKDGSGYPQLSAEYLVKADPDLIFLADTKCCGQGAQTLAKRSGFGDLSAVERGEVIPLDDDIASRWGPRVVDFLRTVADAAAKAPATGG